jgi:hypothetical protein
VQWGEEGDGQRGNLGNGVEVSLHPRDFIVGLAIFGAHERSWPTAWWRVSEEDVMSIVKIYHSNHGRVLSQRERRRRRALLELRMGFEHGRSSRTIRPRLGAQVLVALAPGPCVEGWRCSMNRATRARAAWHTRNIGY